MTQDIKIGKTPAVRPDPAAEDLSEAIAQAVETQADEKAIVVRVFGDHYRCNWWVRETTAHWMSHITGSIRRSCFLRATKHHGKLILKDLSDRH